MSERTFVIAATHERAMAYIKAEGLTNATVADASGMIRGATNAHFVFVGPWRNREGADIIEDHVVTATAFGGCRITHVNREEAVQ